MDEIGLVFGWKAGAILIFLDLLGWLYALVVYVLLPKWKIERSSSGLVVGGVLFTVFGYGFLIGWEATVTGFVSVIALLACFVATGLPMMIGYKFKIEYDINHDNQRAKLLAREALRDALKKLNGGGNDD